MASPSPTASADARWPTLRLRRVATGTVLVMLVALSFILLLQLRNVLIAVLLGILLATALRPVMDGLRRVKVARHLSAFGAVALLVLVLVGIAVVMTPMFVAQGQLLLQRFPSLYSDLRIGLLSSQYQIVRQLGWSMPPSFEMKPEMLIDQLVQQIIAWVPTIGHIVFLTISVLLFTYYWLVYRERSLRGMLLLLAEERRAPMEAIWVQIEDKIGAFLRGQVVLAVAVGGLSLVGYWLVGMPYALLLGLVAGVLEFIPYLGPLITAVFSAAIGFTVSPTLGLAAIVVALIVQQVENTVLVPRIMGNTVGVSPVVTLLAIAGFGALFGLGGALLAIPLAAVLQVLFNSWLEQSGRAVTEEGVRGRGRTARIRYQLLDLLQDLRMRLRNKDEEVGRAMDEPEEDLEQLLADLDDLLNQLERETQ